MGNGFKTDLEFSELATLLEIFSPFLFLPVLFTVRCRTFFLAILIAFPTVRQTAEAGRARVNLFRSKKELTQITRHRQRSIRRRKNRNKIFISIVVGGCFVFKSRMCSAPRCTLATFAFAHVCPWSRFVRRKSSFRDRAQTMSMMGLSAPALNCRCQLIKKRLAFDWHDVSVAFWPRTTCLRVGRPSDRHSFRINFESR